MKIIKMLFGYCSHCERYFKYPKRRRINTCYEDDENNYSHECKECYERTIEYYDNMWNDYNSGRY